MAAPTSAGAAAPFEVRRDTPAGPYRILEDGRPVLQYNHATVQPGELIKGIAEANLIYARPRSDYIHPLYGLDGETLTKDWSPDHPHHRGIYWAWPEVGYRGELGDLHALQIVFARPVGQCAVSAGPHAARIVAQSRWMWADREPIVHETASITVHRRGPAGRMVDLQFTFDPLVDGVTLARRGTSHYGGLNIRMAAVEGQKIVFRTDAPGAAPRMAWAELSGLFANRVRPSGMVVLQNALNPEYPGEWVQYPELNWYQPTFPTAGTRYLLRKGAPLTLRWRLWVHRGGPMDDAACAAQWRAYNPPSR